MVFRLVYSHFDPLKTTLDPTQIPSSIDFKSHTWSSLFLDQGYLSSPDETVRVTQGYSMMMVVLSFPLSVAWGAILKSMVCLYIYTRTSEAILTPQAQPIWVAEVMAGSHSSNPHS